MPKIKYVSHRFNASSQIVIDKANEILIDYANQGYDLTLRQLYYQFVSRDIIANSQREYKKLGSIVNDARLAGLIDWDHIVDRTRNIRGNSHWDNPASIIEVCAKQFLIDKWSRQPYRVEVWIEKDALVGVLERVCRQLDVSYFSCRGYTSQSEIHEAARDRLRPYEKAGQRTLILHLGDHDPSGVDMTRDIKERLHLFGCKTQIKRIALNMDQVQKYQPPPNPAKIDDSRAAGYIAEFGDESWELDALEPRVITKLITNEVLAVRDESRWKEAVARETAMKTQLEACSHEWDAVVNRLREDDPSIAEVEDLDDDLLNNQPEDDEEESDEDREAREEAEREDADADDSDADSEADDDEAE